MRAHTRTGSAPHVYHHLARLAWPSPPLTPPSPPPPPAPSERPDETPGVASGPVSAAKNALATQLRRPTFHPMSEKPIAYRASLDQARSVQEIQASKPPFVLYHYTTRSGLFGMLTSGRLHASHILYLNDHKEFSYAEGLAEEPIRARAESSSPYQDIYRAFANWLPTIALRYETRTVFVFSMSENRDQLSQWRAYSQPSDGYCVGFRTPELLTTVGKDFHIVQCTYDEMWQQNVIRMLLDDTETDFERNLAAGVLRSDAVLRATTFLVLGLSSLAPALKHPAFSEEKEWRRVLEEHERCRIPSRTVHACPVSCCSFHHYEQLSAHHGYHRWPHSPSYIGVVCIGQPPREAQRLGGCFQSVRHSLSHLVGTPLKPLGGLAPQSGDNLW